MLALGVSPWLLFGLCYPPHFLLPLFTHVTWACLINLCKLGQVTLQQYCIYCTTHTCNVPQCYERTTCCCCCCILPPVIICFGTRLCYGNNLRQQCKDSTQLLPPATIHLRRQVLPPCKPSCATPFARQFHCWIAVVWHIYISILRPPDWEINPDCCFLG